MSETICPCGTGNDRDECCGMLTATPAPDPVETVTRVLADHWRDPVSGDCGSGACPFAYNGPGSHREHQAAEVVAALNLPGVRAQALRDAAGDMEAQARRQIAQRSDGKKSRQRARNASRGHAAASTLRWAKTLTAEADRIEGA